MFPVQKSGLDPQLLHPPSIELNTISRGLMFVIKKTADGLSRRFQVRTVCLCTQVSMAYNICSEKYERVRAEPGHDWRTRMIVIRQFATGRGKRMRIDVPLLFTTWLGFVGNQLRKHDSPLRGFLVKRMQGQVSCSTAPVRGCFQ